MSRQRVLTVLRQVQERLFDASESVLDVTPTNPADRTRLIIAVENIRLADELISSLTDGEKPIKSGDLIGSHTS